jgi:hypothetical protein
MPGFYFLQDGHEYCQELNYFGLPSGPPFRVRRDHDHNGGLDQLLAHLQAAREKAQELIGMHGTTVAVEAAQRWEIAIQSVIREVIAIKYPKGRP